MLLSDLTRKLKGAHNIPIPTPLITGFLPFFMKRTPLFSPSRFPPPPPSLFAPATKVTLLLENANQEEGMLSEILGSSKSPPGPGCSNIG